MRVWIQMDQRAAMRAGRDVQEQECVDVDLGALSEDQRRLLSEHVRPHISTTPNRHERKDWFLDRIESLGAVTRKLPGASDATTQTVADLLDMIPALIEEGRAQYQREREEDAQRKREREEDRERERQEHERERQEAIATLNAMSNEELIADATETDKQGYMHVNVTHRWRDLLREKGTYSGYPNPEATCGEAHGLAMVIATAIEDHNTVLREQHDAEEAQHAAEREQWIAAHGSERLRRSLAEGIECRAAYLDERLAVERPGWEWYQEVPGDYDDPRNPPAEAFAILDRARAVDAKSRLVWWTKKHQCDESCYPCDDCPTYDREEYCAVAEFLGRDIVLFASGIPRMDAPPRYVIDANGDTALLAAENGWDVVLVRRLTSSDITDPEFVPLTNNQWQDVLDRINETLNP